MYTRVQKTSYFLANVLTISAIFVFASGFFPHKAFLPGLAAWRPGQSVSQAPSPFNRVIFMVVDALRSDFVYGLGSNFNFTQSLIRSGAAVPFTGHASPPTITMPRVKAITTGSVPSFLDVVLNFAESDTSSTLAMQDTWLAQMKAKPQGKLVMYGDDTWLKLFPGFFERADGTTSFFVSDFTEVDNNVTRHVPEELVKDDWSAMILHYLGLDHIGHKSGPRSPNMPAKQREMDEVVREIYHAMEKHDHLASSLLVLSGDHGMNEAGNHGGSSSGEVSTALLFISPKFMSAFTGFESPLVGSESFEFYGRVEQSDIAPTLAALLGFPVPRNNLGMIIPTFLELWAQDNAKLDLLFENAHQMATIAKATFPLAFSQYTSAEMCQPKPAQDLARLACEWREADQSYYSVQIGNSSALDAMALTWSFLRDGQEMLSGTASNYNLNAMSVGIGIATIGVVLAMLSNPWARIELTLGSAAYGLVIMGYAIIMFASSYVEEEQQFWYWALGGWLVAFCCRESRYEPDKRLGAGFSALSVAALFGISRHWNQTGQKYAGDPDISSRILPAYTLLLWFLVVATYMLITLRISHRATSGERTRQISILSMTVCFAAFTFKVAFTAADAPELLRGVGILSPLVVLASRIPLVAQARVVFIGVAQLFVYATYRHSPWVQKADRRAYLGILHDLISLFLVTQSRASNIPLFLIFYAQFMALLRCRFSSLTDLTVTALLLQYSSFFVLGGSNAISSVDLSNAYNGIAGYNVLAVGILTFISNWAGPIWWAFATAVIMDTTPAIKRTAVFEHFTLLTLFAACSTLSVMVACMVLREHLFIWTVFSPKFLFTVAWVVGHHLLVNDFLGHGLLGTIVSAKP